MIEQQHNAIGRWELSLAPGLPKHVRSAIENFGHVVITPGPLAGPLDRSALLAASMYTGLVLKHRKRFDLSVEMEGSNLLTWLGYSETRGPYPQFTGLTASGTPLWSDIVSTSSSAQMGFFRPIHDATNGIELGTVYGGTTFSGAQGVVTANVTRWQMSPEGPIQKYGVPSTPIEYRVSPAGVFDTGDPTISGFWRTTPEVILTRGSSLRDQSLLALKITELDVEYDATTYATEAGARAGELGAIAYSSTVSNTIKNFTGTSGARWAVIQQIDVDADAADRQAAADSLIDYQGESIAVTVSVESHPTLPTFLEPGDYVWIHDPDTGLEDNTYQVMFAGHRINPSKVRVYGTSWPVTIGRGVYFASNNWQTIIDLAPYMEWESGDTELTVGSPAKSKVLPTETLRRLL